MSVLVFADSTDGKFKKTAFEVVSYGKKVAEQLDTNLVVLTINPKDASELYTYGAEKVLTVSNDSLSTFNAKEYAGVVVQAAKKENATVVVVDSSINSLYMTPLVAVGLEAGYASNTVSAPSNTNPFTVKRKAFSNKAFSNTIISTEKKVIGLAKNSFGIHENPVGGALEIFDAEIVASGVKSKSVERVTGKVTIADADTVVSAGRGLKGPENW